MSTRYPGLPICQHIAIGAALQDIRDTLMDITSDVHEAYPKTSTPARQAQAALKYLDQLRTALDNVSAAENPRDEDWSTRIYYGQDRERRAPVVADILDRHMESRPGCCR